jgi:hypothetical protein
MALPKNIASFYTCSRCGAVTHLPGACFCGHCGASLGGGGSEMPSWQRPAPARYAHIAMSRMALSCPECGEPMKYGFRKICRRCGAKLVMIPRLLHANHVRVYVAGPRAALTALLVEGTHLVIILAVLVMLGKACTGVH